MAALVSAAAAAAGSKPPATTTTTAARNMAASRHNAGRHPPVAAPAAFGWTAPVATAAPSLVSPHQKPAPSMHASGAVEKQQTTTRDRRRKTRAHPVHLRVHGRPGAVLVVSSRAVCHMPPPAVGDVPVENDSTGDSVARLTYLCPDFRFSPLNAESNGSAGANAPAGVPCDPYLGCPRGPQCPMAHADISGAAEFVAHELDPAWRTADEVTYRRLPPGTVIQVAPPNCREGCEALPSELCLFTHALDGDRSPLSYCAHFVRKGVCDYGEKCCFVHALDRSMLAGPKESECAAMPQFAVAVSGAQRASDGADGLDPLSPPRGEEGGGGESFDPGQQTPSMVSLTFNLSTAAVVADQLLNPAFARAAAANDSDGAADSSVLSPGTREEGRYLNVDESSTVAMPQWMLAPGSQGPPAAFAKHPDDESFPVHRFESGATDVGGGEEQRGGASEYAATPQRSVASSRPSPSVRHSDGVMVDTSTAPFSGWRHPHDAGSGMSVTTQLAASGHNSSRAGFS